MNGICRLCLEEKKLIEAHIIPEGFFKFLYPENSSKPLHIMANDGGYTKSPIGEYDSGILCAECDNKIGVYDNYAQQIILNKEPIKIEGTKEAELIESVDYPKLKLFFISLLWRGSISKRMFFRNIDVGPFEEILRNFIYNNNPGDARDFSIAITRFTSVNLKEINEKNIAVPFSVKNMDGLNMCVFYLPRGYKIYIKVDSRNFDQVVSQLILAPNRPLYILNEGSFDKSPEFNRLLNAVRSKIK